LILASPELVEKVAPGLDHAESLFIDDDGTIFAGGEKGQVYRVAPGEAPEEYAHTHGELLGLVLDRGGRAYICDCAHKAVFRVSPNGKVEMLSQGSPGRKMTFPNHPAFDASGNLFVSDSGDYWDKAGTGCIFVVRPDGSTELFHSGPFRFANGVAVDPTGEWLYIAQSSAWNIVRISLNRPESPIDVAFQLPPYTIPDGMVFSSDGSLLVACYRPDSVIRCRSDGTVETVVSDPTGECLLAPTNVFLHGGYMYVANLAGRFVSRIKTDLPMSCVHRPEP
jgi:gluconolactonase